jgi:hypothetical protein
VDREMVAITTMLLLMEITETATLVTTEEMLMLMVMPTPMPMPMPTVTTGTMPRTTTLAATTSEVWKLDTIKEDRTTAAMLMLMLATTDG